MVAFFAAAGTITGSSHFVSAASLLALGGAVLHSRRQLRRTAAVRQQERALRKELLAYLLYQSSPQATPMADLGRQVSRLIAVRSSFPRAALMLRDPFGEFVVAGSAGFDDLGVEAMNRWGRRISQDGTSLGSLLATHERVGTSAFVLHLERRFPHDENPLSTMLCGKVHIVPLRTADRLLGMLVVSADPRPASRMTDVLELTRSSASQATVLPMGDLLEPLEGLALRLTMQMVAGEHAMPVSTTRLPHQHGRHAKPAGGPRKGLAENKEVRRNLDMAASPLNHMSTAVALDRIRQIITPGSDAPQRVAGVSGRPPRSIWRTGGAAAH